MGADFAAPLYSYAMYLAKKSGRLSLSIGELAIYFGADERSISKAIRKLVKAGFFVRLKAEPGKPVSYGPVAHKEWANKHPGSCLEKAVMPWSDEKVDPLVSGLHAASDGRLRLYANFVQGLRNTGHRDDQIVMHWNAFYAADNPEGPKWKGVFARFMAYLRDQEIKSQ